MTAAAPDVVSCHPGRGRLTDAATSNETFNAWIRHNQLDVDGHVREPDTETRATDAMAINVTSARYFRGHVGGGGGTWAIYDPHHRVLAYCQMYDTAQGLFIAGNIRPPPFPVLQCDLSAFASRNGLRLGSSVSAVRRVYGWSSFVSVHGKPELRYARFIKSKDSRDSAFGISTVFVFMHGNVVQIERISGN